ARRRDAPGPGAGGPRTGAPYDTRNVGVRGAMVGGIGMSFAGGIEGFGSDISAMAMYLCGRGVGLTPSGDDMLVGWMAVGWLLYGALPSFLEACECIVGVAERQTHLLSQCWLRYAAQGNVAEPIGALLA